MGIAQKNKKSYPQQAVGYKPISRNQEGRKEPDKKWEESRSESIGAEDRGAFDAGTFEGDAGVIAADKGNKEPGGEYKETDKATAEAGDAFSGAEKGKEREYYGTKEADGVRNKTVNGNKDSKEPREVPLTWGILIIGILTFLVFANTFLNEFAYDDHIFIEGNLEIRKLENIPSFFAKDNDRLYRPLREVVYSLMYQAAGLKPFGYHALSILLHLSNSILVFLIARRLLSPGAGSLAAAVIFAVHPIHTERVANMTAGFDQAGIFLLLVSIYLYILFREKGAGMHYHFSWIAALPAVFASEEALIVTPLILLYDLLFLGWRKIKLRTYLPFLAISGGYLFIRFFLIGVIQRAGGFGAGFTLTTMVVVFAKYFRLLVVPYPLTLAPAVIIPKSSFFQPKVIFSLFIILAVAGAALSLRKKAKAASFSLFWIFAALLPFSQIIPLQTVIAERYLYVPSVGFSLFFGWLIHSLITKFQNPAFRKGVFVAVCGVVLLFSILTVSRNAEWRNDFTLWESAIKVPPLTSTALGNLGVALERMGKFKDAQDVLQKAIFLDPGNFKAHANLGLVAYKTGQFTLAELALRKAIKLSPAYGKAYSTLGLLYLDANATQDAFAAFTKAIELNPQDFEAYNNLGIWHGDQGNYSGAKEYFRKSLSINPQYREAAYNLDLIEGAEKPRRATT